MTKFKDLLGGNALAKLKEVKREHDATARELRKIKNKEVSDMFRYMINRINRAPIPQLDIYYDKNHKLQSIVVERTKYMPAVSEDGVMELWNYTDKSFTEPLTVEQFINRYSWDVDSGR